MDYNELRNFWTPFFAYVTLAGVYFILLGIALAFLASAARVGEKRTKRALPTFPEGQIIGVGAKKRPGASVGSPLGLPRNKQSAQDPSIPNCRN